MMDSFAMLFGFLALVATAVALVRALPWPRSARAAALFGLIYLVMVMNTGIEWAIFSTATTAELLGHFALGAATSAVCAVAIAWLVPRATAEAAPGAAFAAQVRSRGPGGWLWRLVAVAAGYVLLYFLVGGVAFTYTRPYYVDPVYGLNLTLPPVALVFEVQLARALVFALALWPWLAADAAPGRGWRAGLALAVLGGFAPLALNVDWPAALRAYHAIEILLQNFPFGLLVVGLCARRRPAAESPAAIPSGAPP